MSEIGNSLKEAYQVLDIMPSPAEREVLRHMAALQPVISAVQSLPLAEIQRNYEVLHAVLPSQAEIQAANQAAQMMKSILPQYEAFQRIARMSNMISVVERPALFANGLIHTSETEEDEPGKEIEQPDQEKGALLEENDTDDSDAGSENSK